jgi:uncharacterized protein
MGFVVLTIALPASAQTFPRLTGRVVDDAAVLDTGMRDSIAQRLKALEDQTSDQLVVATVCSLQGYAIEDYANRLFRQWQLGRSDKNNGVLLLIAPAEHKVRIEVGYGLEGTLTDAVSKLIIENHLIPWLRQSRYDVAASTGVDDIVQVLTGHAAEWQERARARPASSHVHDLGVIQPWSPLWILIVVVFGGAFLLFFGAIGMLILMLVLRLLVFIHLLPHAKDRQGGWLWLNRFDPPVDPRSLRRSHRSSSSSSSFWSSSSDSSSSSSSSSSDSFSGGGGSSGGGGASGSW